MKKVLIQLDTDPQPREEAFLSAGVRMLYGRGNLAPADLVDTLASALDPYRAAAAEIPALSPAPGAEGRRDFRSQYRDS